MSVNQEGTNLAKVLYYYGFIEGNISDEYKIVCPFHDDINPSMKIDLINGNWFCFGCQRSGDAIKFVSEIEKKRNNLNDLQALIKYCKILKSEKTEKINLGLRVKKTKNFNQSLIEAKDYYYNLRSIDWTVKPKDNDIKDAGLYMKSRGFTFRVLTDIGCRYTYNDSYPLIFPMLDNGDFMGWVCRTTSKSIESKRKYLYNTGFSRRNTLCGNYTNDKPLYVVEGFMDMLKLKMFGVDNVVAILGWKMTNEQIIKLKKAGITKIVSALDNDQCGENGSIFLKVHFDVVRFVYNDGIKDPGDMNSDSFNKMNKITMRKYRRDGN